MANKIQIRRDTAANWTSTNPTLSQGEQGYEIDTSKFKIGDGTTAWTSLSYFTGYTDTNVDTHLNTSTATSGEVLSWTGTDYDWITAGGGGADLYAANESSPTAQPSATGTNAIAIGDSAVSSGIDSFAGSNSRASGTASVAFSVSNNTTSYGASGSRAASIGFRTIASGSNAFSAGYYAKASGISSIALGQSTEATHTRSLAFGNFVNSSAADQVSIGSTSDTVRISERYTLPTADGTNGQVMTTNGSGAVTFADAGGGGGADLYSANESSPTAQPSATGTNAIAIGDSATSTGTESFAIGKSLASGTESFAATIDNNSTSYGASGNNSVAITQKAKSSGQNSVAIGKQAIASGVQSLSIGNGTTSSNKSMSFGFSNTVDGQGAVAFGVGARTWGTTSKIVFGANYGYSDGRLQSGIIQVHNNTTDATPVVLSSDSTSTAGSSNQLILPNNSSFTFTGVVSAREKASEGTDVGAWEVKGIIRREGSASTTTLVNSVINDINVPTGWAVAVSADTTNGALAITVTGVASTNIRWLTTLYTAEVMYA